MAIKEFVIGGSEYIQGGYYDLGYFDTNTARTTLNCVANKIRFAQVVTGVYYQDNYIDGTYFHRNSIEAGLIVEAMIVQEAQVTLQGYVQEGYYPTGYYRNTGSAFVLTAELEQAGQDVFAQGTFESSSQVTAQVGVIRASSVSLSATFEQTSTISHIEGADLFAFSEASIAVEVNAIRNNNINASSAFDIAVDAVRGIYVSAQADSLVSFEGIASITRGVEAAVDAAFSLTSDYTNIKQFSSNIETAVELSVDISSTVDIQISLQSSSQLQGTISHIEGADLQAFSNANITAQINAIRSAESASDSTTSQSTVINKFTSLSAEFASNFSTSSQANATISLDSNISSETALTVSQIKIIQFAIDVESLFTPNINCVVTVNSFATLESQSSLIIDNARTRNIDSALTATVTQVTDINVITDTQIDGDSSAVIVVTADRSRDVNANLTSEVSQSATAYRIKQFVIEESSLFSPSVTINAVRNTFAVLESSSALTVSTSRTKEFNAEVNATASIVANITVSSVAASSISSSSSLSAVGIRAIRFIDSAVQGQILTTSGSVEQEEIFPNWARLMLFTPVVVGEGGVELADGKFNNGLKFISRGSAHKLSHGPVYGSAGYLALRLDYENLYDTGVYLQSSTDGVDWIDQVHNIDIPMSYIKKITYANGRYFVLGSDTVSGYIYISYSTDMENWTNWSTNTLGTNVTDIIYSNNLYLLLCSSGSTGRIYSSSNLTSWTLRHSRTYSVGYSGFAYTCIATSGTNSVVMGVAYDPTPGLYYIQYAYSTNGTSWTSANLNLPNGTAVNKVPYDIVWGGTAFAMVGSGGMVYFSSNMTTWTASSTGTSQDLYSVAVKDGGTYVFGDNILITNTSGSTWVTQTLPVIESDDLLYKSNGATRYAKISYNNGQWIAGDWTSANGTDWTILDYQIPNKQPFIKYDYTSEWNTWKTLDMWTYIPEHPYQFTTFGLASKRGAVNATAWSFYIEAQSSGSLTLRMAWTGSLRYSFTITNSFVYSDWNHIRVVSNGTTGAVYLNGTRLGTITPPAEWATGEDTLNIGLSSWVAENQRSRNVDYYLDEVMISQEAVNDPALTSITVPTAPWQNNDYTSILLHYDTNFEDDASTPLRNAEADLTSAFTQSSSAIKTSVAVASITSQVTLQVDTARTRDVSADLSSQFALSTSALDLDLAEIALTVSTQVTATAGIVKQSVSNQESATSISVDNIRIRYASANFEAFDTLLVAVGRTQEFGSYIEVQSAIVVSATKTAVNSASLSTTSSLTAPAQKLNGGSAVIASATALAIVYQKVIEFISTPPTVSSMSVIANATIDASASISSTSSISIATSNEVRISGSLFGTASLVAQGKLTRTVSASVQSTTSCVTITNNVVRTTANLTVSAFELVSGKVISLNDSPTWVIPAENRTSIIPAQVTEWTISFEDRTYKLQG